MSLAAELGGINCGSDLQKHVRLFPAGPSGPQVSKWLRSVWSGAQGRKSDVSASVQNPHHLSHAGPIVNTQALIKCFLKDVHICMRQAKMQGWGECQRSSQQGSLECLLSWATYPRLYSHPHSSVRARCHLVLNPDLEQLPLGRVSFADELNWWWEKVLHVNKKHVRVYSCLLKDAYMWDEQSGAVLSPLPSDWPLSKLSTPSALHEQDVSNARSSHISSKQSQVVWT